MNSSMIDAARLHENILEANYIALTVHVNPDSDAIGSMLALYEYLRSIGKRSVMVIDDNIPRKYLSLPYADEIVRPENIEDPQNIDFLVVLDASTYERIGCVGPLLSHASIVNIDHHISNTHFADLLFLDANAAATGEIITDLTRVWNTPISPSMANALYMAIVADCGFFKFSNTTEKTLNAGAYCVASGADTQAVADIIETTTVKRLKATAQILSNVSFFENNRIAMLSLTPRDMELVEGDTDGLVDFIRNVEHVEVAVVLKGKTNEITRVSLRSKGVDVNAVASKFGGGGHIRAAGCTVHANLEESSHKIISAIMEILPN